MVATVAWDTQQGDKRRASKTDNQQPESFMLYPPVCWSQLCVAAEPAYSRMRKCLIRQAEYVAVRAAAPGCVFHQLYSTLAR